MARGPQRERNILFGVPTEWQHEQDSMSHSSVKQNREIDWAPFKVLWRWTLLLKITWWALATGTPMTDKTWCDPPFNAWACTLSSRGG